MKRLQIKRENIGGAVLLSLLSLPSLFVGDDTRLAMAACHSSPWWTFLTFHLVHANLWHYLANVMALLMFRPRWATITAGFVCSTLSVALLALLLPHAQPVGGLSALIFACFARQYASWKKSVWLIVVINLVFIVIPGVAWAAHLLSFFSSYLLWRNLSVRATKT